MQQTFHRRNCVQFEIEIKAKKKRIIFTRTYFGSCISASNHIRFRKKYLNSKTASDVTRCDEEIVKLYVPGRCRLTPTYIFSNRLRRHFVTMTFLLILNPWCVPHLSDSANFGWRSTAAERKWNVTALIDARSRRVLGSGKKVKTVS